MVGIFLNVSVVLLKSPFENKVSIFKVHILSREERIKSDTVQTNPVH